MLLGVMPTLAVDVRAVNGTLVPGAYSLPDRLQHSGNAARYLPSLELGQVAHEL